MQATSRTRNGWRNARATPLAPLVDGKRTPRGFVPTEDALSACDARFGKPRHGLRPRGAFRVEHNHPLCCEDKRASQLSGGSL